MKKIMVTVFWGMVAVISSSVVYAQQGGWNVSLAGPSFQYKGMLASSPAFLPPSGLGVTAAQSVTVVYWLYQLKSPAPIDLAVKLCAANRCINLDGASGQTYGLQGIPANSEFRMLFYVPGSGRMATSVDVVSNEISVNYK
ncbi:MULTISPECIES: flagellar protein FlhE [Dickeya]|uniref:flagellar protein FlhE n=1 Tax=Dickeya TaxID=204037 RepID=UPI0002D42EDD|nr:MULTISPECIES: flagellar protein FlhE [Dickeya]AJC66850.1 flagellar FlhE family protein [Dickeya zeae EC1]